jgi:hypothetical protein
MPRSVAVTSQRRSELPLQVDTTICKQVLAPNKLVISGYDHRVCLSTDPTGDAWRRPVRMRGSVEQDRLALGRLIDEDADPAEISYYESLSDPQVRMLNKAQRAYEGQYRRRIRRLAAKAKDDQGH